jgi:hypothetical protein
MGAKGLPDNVNLAGGPGLVARLSRKGRSVRRATWFQDTYRWAMASLSDFMATLTSDRVDRCRRCCGPARTVSSSTPATRRSHRTFHVERDDNTAKFWLGPVRLQSSGGFKPFEVRRIQRLVEQHREALLRSWDAYFSE